MLVVEARRQWRKTPKTFGRLLETAKRERTSEPGISAVERHPRRDAKLPSGGLSRQDNPVFIRPLPARGQITPARCPLVPHLCPSTAARAATSGLKAKSGYRAIKTGTPLDDVPCHPLPPLLWYPCFAGNEPHMYRRKSDLSRRLAPCNPCRPGPDAKTCPKQEGAMTERQRQTAANIDDMPSKRLQPHSEKSPRDESVGLEWDACARQDAVRHRRHHTVQPPRRQDWQRTKLQRPVRHDAQYSVLCNQSSTPPSSTPYESY